jgi:hypothetical protein
MTATLTHTSELPASGLAGPVNVDALFLACSWDELVGIGESALEAVSDSYWKLTDCILAVGVQAGDLPSQRGRALAEYARELNLAPRTVERYFQVGRYMDRERRGRFEDLPYGVIREVVMHSAVPGETPETRDARIETLLEQASDENLGVRAAARMVEQAVAAETGAAPPADAYADLPALLVAGLVERLKRTEPGTWPQIVAEVEAHLTERLPAVRERFVARSW